MDDFNEGLEKLRKKQVVTCRHIQELKKIAAAMTKLMADQNQYSVHSHLCFQRSILDGYPDEKQPKLGKTAIPIEQIREGYAEVNKQIEALENDIALNSH